MRVCHRCRQPDCDGHKLIPNMLQFQPLKKTRKVLNKQEPETVFMETPPGAGGSE